MGPVEVVGCDTEHFAEIHHTGDIYESGYSQHQDSVAVLCTAAFPSLVGVPRTLAVFTSEPFTVGEAEWQAGEREFSCVLFLGNEDHPLVGSARDSWH